VFFSALKTTNSITDDDVVHNRKRQRLDTSPSSNESPEEKILKPEITITIPKDLKSRLVDDWHAINSQSKLIELPAKITVDDIVAQYKKSKSSSKGGVVSCEDISNGILVCYVLHLALRQTFYFRLYFETHSSPSQYRTTFVNLLLMPIIFMAEVLSK